MRGLAIPFRRAAEGSSTGAPADGGQPEDGVAPLEDTVGPLPAPRRRTRRRLLHIGAACLVTLVLVAGGLYPFRHRFTDRAADLSRQVIGDENTARLEAWYFRLEDRLNSLRYRLTGGPDSAFGAARPTVRFRAAPAPGVVQVWAGPPLLVPLPRITPEIVAGPPLVPPDIRSLDGLGGSVESGWSTVGLPRSSPGDALLMKASFRPDPARPYAQVGVLLIDHRRVRLHLRGGTGEPGGDRGVHGPGAVAPTDLDRLIAAWTGGFKGPHGGFGMYADGQEYRPLRDGLASLVVYGDGTIRMGEWGRHLAWSDDIEAVRQNAVLLVEEGEISGRVGEGNDTWGYVQVNSAEFITWRSAVGLTADGDLLVAAGNSLSAATLGRALWAAGAHWGMQLDINSPYVLIGLYFQELDGSLTAERFMPSMPDSPGRFLSPHDRDLMYVTLDEARFYTIGH